jgi:hypothetical protein
MKGPALNSAFMKFGYIVLAVDWVLVTVELRGQPFAVLTSGSLIFGGALIFIAYVLGRP